MNYDTLFVFVDESGNLDFSPKGTAHYVLAAVATTDPFATAEKLQALKYHYLDDGVHNIEFFHASEDRQAVRNKVLASVASLDDKLHVHYIHVRKNRVSPENQSSAVFYSRLGSALSKYIIKHHSEGFSRVVIIFDKCLKGKEQDVFLKTVKTNLKGVKKPYRIYFHRTLTDFNGQIADYLAWSKYVSLEKGENRPLEVIQNLKQTDFELFSRSRTEYY